MHYAMVNSDFHGGGEYKTVTTIEAATAEQARHKRECSCGGPGILVRGSAEELAAAGAYEAMSGVLVLNTDIGYLPCERL